MAAHRRTVALVAVALLLMAAGVVVAVLASRPPPPAAAGFGGRAWTPGTAAPWQRTEVGAAALGGEVWVAGGFEPDGAASAAVAAYDPRAGAWRDGPALPQPLHHTAVAGNGTRLVVAGGYTTAQLAAPTAAVWSLDPATGRWESGPPLPGPRAAGALVSDGSRLVYAGGVGPAGVARDVFALENGRWHRIGELSSAREHLAAAADGNGTAWFLGGRAGGIDANLAHVDVVRGASVRRVGELPTARGGVAGFHVPGVGGCAAGGEGPDGTFAEVECLTADGAVSTLPPLAAARHGLGTAVLDGTAYALLGGPEPGLTTSDTVQTLDVTTEG